MPEFIEFTDSNGYTWRYITNPNITTASGTGYAYQTPVYYPTQPIYTPPQPIYVPQLKDDIEWRYNHSFFDEYWHCEIDADKNGDKVVILQVTKGELYRIYTRDITKELHCKYDDHTKDSFGEDYE